MRRDPRKYLWDAREAAEAVRTFVSGRTLENYLADLMLRSAVERQLGIVGEALGQLARHAPEIAETIPDLSRVVAFRNLLVHGYAQIDDERVWAVVHENLPPLLSAIDRSMRDEAEPPAPD